MTYNSIIDITFCCRYVEHSEKRIVNGQRNGISMVNALMLIKVYFQFINIAIL